MILLDTNVLSALMHDAPEPAVVSWLNSQPASSIWTSSITVLEVRTGLELLEPSRRRQRLEEAFSLLVSEDLDGRVLTFDSAAAEAAGRVVAAGQRAGRSMEIRDAQIAGIALSRKATLATRNIRHFKGLGIELVDPGASDEHAS